VGLSLSLSLRRRRVCNLQLLLFLASAVILGAESRGSRDHILLSQIRVFPLLLLLRLAGLRWRYSTPLPHGVDSCGPITFPFMIWRGPQTEHTLERFVCCYLRIRCHSNACSPKTVVRRRSIPRCSGMCSAKRRPPCVHIRAFRRHDAILTESLL
jgi:hypothetical protein